MTIYFLYQKLTCALIITTIFITFYSVDKSFKIQNNSYFQTYAEVDMPLKDMKYYENPELGISLFYPKDWEITQVKNGVQFFKIANTIVEIRSNDLKENVGLEQYIREYIDDKREKRKDFNLISSQQYLLNGTVPAYNIIYTFTLDDEKETQYNGQTLKVYRIITLNEDKVYNIGYTSSLNDFDSFLNLAKEIISSVKIHD